VLKEWTTKNGVNWSDCSAAHDIEFANWAPELKDFMRYCGDPHAISVAWLPVLVKLHGSQPHSQRELTQAEQRASLQ
jgi:hypothetical protein